MEDPLLLNHFGILSKPIDNSTSILHLRNSISVDNLLDSKRKKNAFIPFFQERDRMGKLLSQNFEEIVKKTRDIKSAVPDLITHKNRLLRKVLFI